MPISAARRSGSWALLAVAVALAALLGGPGCKDKKKVVKKPKVEQTGPDWNSEWGSVRSDGMEGKFFCEQGLKKVQEAATPEERTKGYEEIVKGYKLVQRAVNKADAMLEAAQRQAPGKNFDGWGDEVAGWQELLKPAKAVLPEEYSSKLHE